MRRGPVALSAAVLASMALSAHPAGIERVGWIRGCWEQVSGERTVEEQWMAPRDGRTRRVEFRYERTACAAR